MTKILQDLEKRRKELGMTYNALAIKSGLMPNTVRGIMQGWQSPKIETLRILAGALGIEVKVVARAKGGIR